MPDILIALATAFQLFPFKKSLTLLHNLINAAPKFALRNICIILNDILRLYDDLLFIEPWAAAKNL